MKRMKRMKRRLWVALGLVLAGCGGESLGDSASQVGFYTLSLSISGMVTSPASSYNGQVTIPADRIEGNITLLYDGSATPLKAGIKKAEVCISAVGCFPLGISGVILPGQTMQFNVETNAYKYNPPWIVLNPYEDVAVEENILSDTLSSGVQNASATDEYYNSQRTLYLSNYPLIEGSLQMSSSGEFKANTIYTGYTSAQGTVTISLVKGVNTANSIVPQSFTASVVSTVCSDDGAGNIVGTDCAGTIDYTNGIVNIAINNVATPTDINMSYRVNGSQTCWDEGGELKGDCVGTIDYTVGELIYRFAFDFVSVPSAVSISYQYNTGTTDGLTYNYTLPQDAVDPLDQNLRITYGDWIGVYSGGTLLCSTDSSDVCSINRSGRQVEVVFSNPQTAPLTIKYTERKKYDFNPSIDANAYNHLWNGQSTAQVDGEVRVEVVLEDGTKLSATAPVTFYVTPQ